jgi:hypothetical protein
MVQLLPLTRGIKMADYLYLFEKLLGVALVPVAFIFFWTGIVLWNAPESAFREAKELRRQGKPMSQDLYDRLTKF